jgi:hypothetical protein
MKYRISNLQIFATPKAESMFQFKGLSEIAFDFDGLVNTILFIHCGLVRASLRGKEDYYEVVGRLYFSYHPEQNEENHIGKLFINIFGHPNNIRYETKVEKF